ncbi:MAG TPA: thiamine pyrophosphate-binding protein, partial [Lacunisphaera sp.]|nr:thiamine pyrophosphate-binding protein [Lacunisphaera sp.]
MKTVRTTTAAAIVRFLQAQYVRRDGVEHRLINGVAGIFGHGNVTGLGQALEEFGGKSLPFYQPKNEQAMVHMAIAYAKTRQCLGTLACTSSVGPGATNMVTGAATATINRLPVLLLPGDIFANRRPGPVLQQLESPASQDLSVNDCFRPVSKYWDRINRPEQILTALPEAMRVLADPAETGAVTIALPEDVQAEAFDCPVNFFAKRVYDVWRPAAVAEAVRAAAKLLRAAKRPLLIAGGGVHYSDACVALRKFAEASGIPVAVTQAGKGALLESHPLGLGAVGVTGTLAANRIATDADVVLVVGTRLSDFTTASKTLFQHPRARFISINVNAADAAKHGALPLLGDARAT